ncbi:MAG TPA: TraM recognition domain-containing protein [Solirubrobacteraceae bacterium]|jgi:type IV secretory pathway TraG/TraD family ATPase VirD4|nr:TraM recognition domain-containing protein [Solirubrobacteraceae bacterium]
MPSNQYPPEGAVDPLSTVEELLHWLLTAAVHCTVGLALGVLAARLMRGRHLHWSWAAGALGLIALVRPGLGDWAFTLALAAACAAIRGRRWHREDIETGADLADIAARRSRPLDLLGALAHMAQRRVRERLGARRWLRGGELQVGVEESGRMVSIAFGGCDGGTHTLVVGATGSGKTVTQTWIAVRAIEHGMGAVVIDPKGDGGMREQVRRAALAAGRPFIEWTPDGDSVYNPFARGGASEIADKALAGERFTEPHYLRQAQRYLGHVVRVLQQSGTEVSLRAMVEQLDPARLEVLARDLPDADARAAFAYLDSLSSRQHSELAGVRDRLAILAESDVGPWLDPQTPGARRFDLLAAVRARAVVYFSLESDSRPLLSEMLGAAIVQDLQTVVASLQEHPAPTLVVIDEFSAIAAEQVVRLFGRARSAGLSLLLGTQELSDLRPPGRERLLEQVLGNLSALIAHRQVVPSSAELIADVAGTRGAWKVSRHSDGRTTRVRTREPVLDADRVMSLGRGWAAVLVLGDGARVRVARMFNNHKKEDR